MIFLEMALGFTLWGIVKVLEKKTRDTPARLCYHKNGKGGDARRKTDRIKYDPREAI